MISTDFEYDGTLLSEMGFMMCSFGGDDLDNVSQGSDITFNTTPVMMGKKHFLVGTKYDSCMGTEFDICKIYSKSQEDYYIPVYQEREIKRWLARPLFYKLRFMVAGHYDIYYNGSFNVTNIRVGTHLVGFHLVFQSDSPFGHEDCKKRFSVEKNGEYAFSDASDDIGYSYMDMSVTCKEAGDLIITNKFNGAERKTIIKNCSEGEVITMKDMIIHSSIDGRDSNIMNDFNFVFPVVYNDYRNIRNIYSFSLACDVEFNYKLARKVGV